MSSPAARNRDNLLPTRSQSHEESGNWSADLDNKFDGLNYINDSRRSRQTTIPQIHDDDEATSMLAGHDDVCKLLPPSLLFISEERCMLSQQVWAEPGHQSLLVHFRLKSVHTLSWHNDIFIIITVLFFTARCTLVQSAVLRSHVVCLSVRPSLCLSVCL